MNNLLLLSLVFLLQFTSGTAILLPLFPQKVTGRSYPRFYYGMNSFFAVLILLGLHRLGGFSLAQTTLALFPLWLFILSLQKDYSKLEQAMGYAYSLFSIAFLFLLPYKMIFHTTGLVSYLPSFLLLLIASIFLSFHINTMIFGHWYLINRELPIVHLKKVTKALIYVSYLRVAACAVSVIICYNVFSVAQFSRLTDAWGHGIFFWGRFLTGLGVPLLVAHLAYESTKIGSNQSATGILYAGNIFVLMGEILALYLFTLTGVVF